MRGTAASYVAFSAYGLFWGMWGSALPLLRDTAGVNDAQLGIALVFVGVGGVPAMLLTGRAVDRFGARIAGILLVTLGMAGAAIALTSQDLATLAVGMALVGVTSGAADVAQNALGGLAEQRTGRRVITIAHGVFSLSVVIGSLGVGALRSAGAGVHAIFLVPGALIVLAGVLVLLLGDPPQPHSPAGTRTRGLLSGWRLAVPFVVIGFAGALGFAIENAHQSWSALFLADELGAGPGLAAAAPATFALCAAITRFAAGVFTRISTSTLLIGGALTAMTGTLILAGAHEVPLALTGLALAAVGTSVLYPTLLSRSTRDVPADRRGRATSVVAATSYLGFICGPAYVGLLADVAGLRGAMAGVAVLAVLFAMVAPLITRRVVRLDERSVGPLPHGARQ
jgi:predicted MFS family arabinose efflux permease